MAVTSFSTVATASTEYGRIATANVAPEVEISDKTLTTEQIVRSYFRDLPVMVQIARCESAFRHLLPDGSVLKGKVDPADTGVMQINKRYHEANAKTMNLNLDDIYHNMAYARYLFETLGTQPWSASAQCWNPVFAMNI